MRSLFFAVMALGTLAGFIPSPAEAGDYPFCLKGREIGMPLGDCRYPSYQACLATASGRGLYCDRNPYFAVGEYPPQRRLRRAHRHPAY